MAFKLVLDSVNEIIDQKFPLVTEAAEEILDETTVDEAVAS
jgi:hypothetical protein